MNISIIGLGFVGAAILKSLKIKGFIENKNLFIYDKYKQLGNLDLCFNSNLIILSLPTNFNENIKKFDITNIYDYCELLSKKLFKGIILIKSTIEPETVDILSTKYKNLKIIHNPEFLTARTAFYDYHNQKHIVLGIGLNCNDDDVLYVKNFFSNYYPLAEISICKSIESESMKLFVNSYYAVKIQFFTELYLLCNKNNSDFNVIKELMLKNGWINKMHTDVPGPDNNISYGGLCFPKDTNSLNQYMLRYKSNNCIIESTIKERNSLRND